MLSTPSHRLQSLHDRQSVHISAYFVVVPRAHHHHTQTNAHIKRKVFAARARMIEKQT